MNLRLVSVISASLLVLSGCAELTDTNGLSSGTSLNSNTNPAIPALTEANSTINCSGWADGGLTYIRQQSLLVINQFTYGVATFACGTPNSEYSGEFIESFIFDNGVWAANGLVAGPEIRFYTTGPCISGDVIRCPAVEVSDKLTNEKPGEVIIFEQDGGLAWRFDLKASE